MSIRFAAAPGRPLQVIRSNGAAVQVKDFAECVRWRTVIRVCCAHPTVVNKYGNIMKTKFATTLLIIGTLLGPVAALAVDSDSDRSHPKAFVKDSAITTEIKTKLAAEHLTSMGRIHV